MYPPSVTTPPQQQPLKLEVELPMEEEGRWEMDLLPERLSPAP